MSTPTLELWIEFASTYSHVAAHRIDAVAAARGVRVLWRPFLLGPIFRDQGLDDSPFNVYTLKGAYMWRDLERLCAKHQIPFRRPSIFPRNGLLAARVATVADAEPWQGELIRGVYRASFGDDQDISDPTCITRELERAGCDDPAAWIERAGTDAVKQRLRERTDEARRLGIFGAPSLVSGRELFWGQDRIEEALDHCVSGATR